MRCEKCNEKMIYMGNYKYGCVCSNKGLKQKLKPGEGYLGINSNLNSLTIHNDSGGVLNIKGETPDHITFRPVYPYKFDPQPDITAYDLALALKGELFLRADKYDGLPESAKKHFQLVEL